MKKSPVLLLLLFAFLFVIGSVASIEGKGLALIGGTTEKRPIITDNVASRREPLPLEKKKVQSSEKVFEVAPTKLMNLTKRADANKGISKERAKENTKESIKETYYNVKATHSGPFIRVFLKSHSDTARFTPKENVQLLNSAGKVVAELPANRDIIVLIKAGQITVNNKKVGSMATFASGASDKGQIMKVDGDYFRGDMIVRSDMEPGKITIINKVPLEDYLYGVVPAEVISNWPMAALEAQAVAARTYALYNMARPRSPYYDVERDTRSQVYDGMSRENNRTSEAVNRTRGEVMLYGGKPIDALFHSDGGGYTESSGNVWGNSLPYLTGVKEDDRNSKGSTYMWSFSMKKSRLEALLKSAGKDVGSLKEIRLSPLGKRPMHESDRTPAGRVKGITFVGTKGSVQVTGLAMMSMLKLRSTLFDFYVEREPKEDVDSGNPYKYKDIHVFKKGDETIYVRGYGWGHGIGLSQWGAADMAKKASSRDKDVYKRILEHYYARITISKMY